MEKVPEPGELSPPQLDDEGTGSPHGLSTPHSDPDIVHNWSNVKAATGLDQRQTATTGSWYLERRPAESRSTRFSQFGFLSSSVCLSYFFRLSTFDGATSSTTVVKSTQIYRTRVDARFDWQAWQPLYILPTRIC